MGQTGRRGAALSSSADEQCLVSPLGPRGQMVVSSTFDPTCESTEVAKIGRLPSVTAWTQLNRCRDNKQHLTNSRLACNSVMQLQQTACQTVPRDMCAQHAGSITGFDQNGMQCSEAAGHQGGGWADSHCSQICGKRGTPHTHTRQWQERSCR